MDFRVSFFTFLCVFFLSLTLRADDYKLRFDTAEKSINNGKGFYQSKNSATLAWGEAYVLQSYLSMYKSYSDISYLDKLTNHFNVMKENLSDPQNDGKLGWQTIDYSVEKVKNSAFTDVASSDSTLPKSWSRWQSTDATVYRSTKAGDCYSNKPCAGLVIKSNPGQGWQVAKQSISYLPGKLYQLSFLGKTNSSGQATVYNVSSGDVLANYTFNNSNWGYHTAQFFTPINPNDQIVLELYQMDHSTPDSIVYFDDVSIRLVAEYLAHDGMILEPIANFILEVQRTPELLAKYSNLAFDYTALIESNFIDKWDNNWKEQPPNSIYTFDNDDLSSYGGGSSLPHNQYVHFAKMLFTMGKVTKKKAYFDRAYAMMTTLKNQLKPNRKLNNAYEWNYSDYIVTNKDNSPERVLAPEYGTYASMDVEVMIDFAHSLSIFDGQDLLKLTKTLLGVMWNDDNGGYIGSNVTTNRHHNNHFDALGGWILLAEVDSSVWVKMDKAWRSFTKFRSIAVDDNHLYRLKILAALADWDPKRVVNRGFEIMSAHDPSMAARWQRYQATSSTIYRSTNVEDRYSGEAGLVIKTAPDKGWQIAEQAVSYVAGQKYKLKFAAKTNGIVSDIDQTIFNDQRGQSY